MSILPHSPSRSRLVHFAVVGVALAAVLSFAWVLFGPAASQQDVHSLSGEPDDTILAQSEEEDADAVEGIDIASIEVTYDTFLSRDPFESIMPPEPASADADPSDPSAQPDPTDPTDPSTPADPSQPGGKDDGVCRTGSEAVCDGIVLEVISTTSDTATIKVNEATYVVQPGQDFATNFLLLEIEGDCASLLYLNGDEGQILRQCVGDRTVK